MKINTKELDREIIKEGITLQSHKLTVIKKNYNAKYVCNGREAATW